VKEKRLMRAKKGLWNGGTIPYGYKSVDKKLVIDPKESKVVKEMFKVFLKSKSRTKVREHLERKDIKNRKGNKWSKTSVEGILSNSIYIGKLYENGEYYDGIHKPIIDPETFNAIQSMTKLDYRGISKSDRVFLLKGLVRCGKHKCAMTPYSVRKSNGDRFYYYFCTKKQNYRKTECKYAYASADKLERYVEERIKEISQQEEVLERIVSGVNFDLEKTATPYKEELESIKLRIKDTKSRIQNLIESLSSLGKKAVTNLVESEIDNLQKDLKSLEKRKGELTLLAASSPSKIDAEIVLQTLKNFSNVYEASLPAEKMTFLQRLIQEVRIEEDDIIIRIHTLTPDDVKQLDLPNGLAPQHGQDGIRN
jgi:site-specific DNA recombinase